MRLALDISPLLGTRAGVGTYVEQLLKALVRLAPQHQFYLYTPHALPAADDAFFRKYPHVRIVRCPSWLMACRTRWDRVDLFHGMNYKLRGRGRYGGVITIHDLALDRIPQPSRKLFGQRWSFLRSRRTARRATRIIAVSQTTAADVAELYGVSRDRIAVVPNGVAAEFHPVSDKELTRDVLVRFGIKEEFILATGGTHPRKNIARLIQAFGETIELHAGLVLVVAGGMGRGGEALKQAVERAGVRDRVIFPGHVTQQELRVLYSSCAVFVFPSLYEGFGLPVLEAMACDAPVVCSHAGALPEVAGDAALLVDPEDVGALGIALQKALHNHELREELRRRGKERVKAFSWERSARTLLEVYAEVARVARN
jgi:glycosyltransferase involved in cell wall biosynthesis